MLLSRMTEEWLAVSNYDIAPNAYDDAPRCPWDSKFTIERLQNSLRYFNNYQMRTWNECISSVLAYHEDEDLKQGRVLIKLTDSSNLNACLPLESKREDWPRSGQRIQWGSEISDVLDNGDTVLPLFAPHSFVVFASKMIKEALEDHSLHPDPNASEWYPLKVWGEITGPDDTMLDAVTWTIDPVLMWQRIDRRIDECV